MAHISVARALGPKKASTNQLGLQWKALESFRQHQKSIYHSLRGLGPCSQFKIMAKDAEHAREITIEGTGLTGRRIERN